ncbi:hypothetical protein DW083_16890 [Parabacteroides sp. AF48-14]|nr:hypothetical protein DW083_16890 [Parabacteroides sp. AF48-14]
MQAFQSGLGTSFFLLSSGEVKTMKKVNSKWIKISDEIEKRPKRGLLYFFRSVCLQNTEKLAIR